MEGEGFERLIPRRLAGRFFAGVERGIQAEEMCPRRADGSRLTLRERRY
jgi:hypothetical protein